MHRASSIAPKRNEKMGGLTVARIRTAQICRPETSGGKCRACSQLTDSSSDGEIAPLDASRRMLRQAGRFPHPNPIDFRTVGNRPVAKAITSLVFALIGFVTTNGRWTLARTATLIATRRGGLPDQPP